MLPFHGPENGAPDGMIKIRLTTLAVCGKRRPPSNSMCRSMRGTMSDPTRALPDHEPPSPEPAPGPGRAKVSGKVRCRVAQGSDSGPGFTDEMSCLLRTRLRLAILI